jgi:exodeoxyribonuclease V beta subunit
MFPPEVLSAAKKIIEEITVKVSPWESDEYNYPVKVSLRRSFQTSYSSLVHRTDSSHLTVEGRLDKEEGVTVTEISEELQVAGQKEMKHVLPGSKQTGTMLHEIFERVRFATVKPMKAPAELLENKDIDESITGGLRQYRMAEIYKYAVSGILWNTLQASFPDPASREEEPLILAGLETTLPEREFHFTFDASGKLFPKTGPSGYVLGYIDLLFRKNDRYYLLDWKSDRLSAYDRDSIAACMEERKYTIQSMLYSLAVHSWLKRLLPGYSVQRNFGGVIYAFVRGMNAGKADGVFTIRPTEEMLEERYPAQITELINSALPARKRIQ